VATLDRRSFLRLTALVAAGPPLACSSDGGSSPPPDRAWFPQSVASGDPRPDGVVLWTRVLDPDHPADDASATLEVATDPGFSQVVARSDLTAAAEHDHVIKVKVIGLLPRTRYHYRFRSSRNGSDVFSPVGRTRTAPSADDPVTIKLAFASCQDFAGRYYNSWQALLDRDDDLDFVIFLGDYIYEYAGGPPERQVALGSGAGVATGLADYRDLYRNYRSDPILQAVHERYPFVVIWDDHEFANDCWGAHSNYTDGAVDEDQPDRRRASEQAFFEYLPIDVPGAPEHGGAYDLGAAPVYPDAHIYRELTFGACLRLLLTDYRSFRPDHLVPEDAHPAALWLDPAGLDALVAAGKAPASLQSLMNSAPYATVDVDALPEVKAELIAAATAEAMAAGVPAATMADRVAGVIKGPLCLAQVNAVLTARGKSALPAGAATGHGFAFIHLGKRQWFTSIGSRYVLVKDLFALYAEVLWGRSGGASERAFGQAQQDWLYGRLAEPAGDRWSMVVGSVSMSHLVLNLAATPGVPPALAADVIFNGDQWDGFPHQKAELLARIQGATKGIYVAGDIHASYASVEGGVPCLTTPAISSGTASQLAASAVTAAGIDPSSQAVSLLLLGLDGLFEQGNPALEVSDSTAHGMVVLSVDVDQIAATYHLIPASEVSTSYAGRSADLAKKTRKIVLKVEPGKITRMI
jgi:alkaline phosphatase D